MIWIECDCCQRTLMKHEPYSEITVKSLGPSVVPMTHTTHICEKCMLKIMKAVEVIRPDAEDRVRKSGELCKLCEREADNDRLRELVKSMYYDLTHMTFPPDWVTDYETDMRELGVEVDA